MVLLTIPLRQVRVGAASGVESSLSTKPAVSPWSCYILGLGDRRADDRSRADDLLGVTPPSSRSRYRTNLAALCRWITMAQDVNITVLPPTGDEPDGSSKFTAIFSLQRLLDPTERPTSSSSRTPHAVQAGAFWPIYMAAHLYLPTYKAEESRRLLWNGRPPGLVGFKVRDDDTGRMLLG